MYQRSLLGILELPHLKSLRFLSNEEGHETIFYTGTINKGLVYNCYHERFLLLTEIDKEMSISSVLTNNSENSVRHPVP